MILLLFNIDIFLYFQGIKWNIVTSLPRYSKFYFTIFIWENNF